MTKRIRHFQTMEELAESARKNAEYWVEKKIDFSFGHIGDAFIVCPCDENGNQNGNGAQIFFESLEESSKFFENFRMVIAHIPGRIKGSGMTGFLQKISFFPKVEETEETARMESGGMNRTILEEGKE